jgi:hypothetical protein
VLAGPLPRLTTGFRKDHVEPCPVLRPRARRRTGRPAAAEIAGSKARPREFEQLAGGGRWRGFNLADRAQDVRLRESSSSFSPEPAAVPARAADQLGRRERALENSRRPPARHLKDRLAALKAKLPVDDKALDEARARPAGTRTSAARGRADRLWVSERRARLSVPDQKDLALFLGLYRCMALFLEGKTVAQAAQDLRLVEVFRSAGDLPSDVSPKVAAVRSRIVR